ncbi:hypothetical protein SP40_31 [Salmonella phage 40]|nr:hypothetical protein SP40_31 [Salmonella phage 40]
MSNESNSIAIGSTASDNNDNYLFCRSIVPGFTSATYAKISDFGPFTDFRVIDGGQSKFFIADNVLYVIGDFPQSLGLGKQS